MNEPQARLVRRIVIDSTLAVLGASVFLYFTWALRALIVPLAVGVLLAYVVRPLVYRIERKGLPHWLAVSLIFLVFAAVLAAVGKQIQAVWPRHETRLALRVRLLHKLNDRYRALLDLNETETKGNTIYDHLGDDLDRLMWKIRQDLWLNPREQQAFEEARAGKLGPRSVSDRDYDYYLANVAVQERAAKRAQLVSSSSVAAGADSTSFMGKFLAHLAEILSVWVVMPVTFLFFLVDQGEIKQAVVGMIPNRYFEPALNVLADMDETVGSYLRGVLLECSMVAVAYMVLLGVVGVNFEWAIIIGLLAGIFNIIPFGGSVIGLCLGLLYALLAEQVHSLLPFVNAGNLWAWVLVIVVITRILDDAVFQPMVLGGALEMHPLVVVLGIVGASLLFGLSGAIFAVPTIALVEVFFRSTMKQLKAYSII